MFYLFQSVSLCLEAIPTGDFDFEVFRGEKLNEFMIAGSSFKFIDFDQIPNLCCLELLGFKSMLGDVDIDLEGILLYACVINIEKLGQVFILEKGRDFLIFKKVPRDETETVLFELYKLEYEIQDGQICFYDFKEDFYERQRDTGLNIMQTRYDPEPNKYDEITEYVPLDSD